MKTRFLLIIACIACLAFTSVKVPAQWVQSSFPTSSQVTDMIYYGNIFYVATNDNGIFQSQDFSTWSPSNSGISTSNIREIITAIEGSFITFYAATDAGVFRSTMMGYSWTAVNNGLSDLNVQTVFSDGTNLFAGTAGGTFRSDNYGQSWSPVTIGAPNQIVRCFIKNGPNLLAGLIGTGDYLYRSTDNGLTWSPYGTGIYETTELIKLGNRLFANSYTVLYYSIDEGATWSLVGPGLPPGMPIMDLTTASDYLWIADIGGGYIQHSDSTNFISITAGMPLGGTNLSAVSVNDEWIVYGTIDNGIWYQPVSVITGINDCLYDQEGFSCFPNPTSGVFGLRSWVFGQKWVMIEIVNSYGKVLKSYNNRTIEQSNNGTVELDISSFPSGVYFIRINIENQMIVKKIIKLL
jgi:photosystem II stability/assembly factor-like uncharacterized protein